MEGGLPYNFASELSVTSSSASPATVSSTRRSKTPTWLNDGFTTNTYTIATSASVGNVASTGTMHSTSTILSTTTTSARRPRTTSKAAKSVDECVDEGYLQLNKALKQKGKKSVVFSIPCIHKDISATLVQHDFVSLNISTITVKSASCHHALRHYVKKLAKYKKHMKRSSVFYLGCSTQENSRQNLEAHCVENVTEDFINSDDE